MSNSFLDEITLGLSPREDPFSEEMEMGSSPIQEEVVPGSPGSQALRDLEADTWPSQQASVDQLLGASQLAKVLSDGSSSGDENDNGPGEELLDDPDSEVEVLEEDVQDPPSEVDVTMDPAPAPAEGSRPSPPPAQEQSWADIMDQEEREGPEPAKTEGALLEEQHTLRRQHSLESLAAFGDSEVEAPGLDLGLLGRNLFLGHHLSPAAACRPYQEVVGRFTSHLRSLWFHSHQGPRAHHSHHHHRVRMRGSS